MKLEIIAANLADIKAINASKADRIEFVQDMDAGGLTPNLDDVVQASLESRVPINVMVRPTDRDFVYTENEFQQMLKDVAFLAQTKVNGLVLGILKADHTIDEERMVQVMVLAGNKEVTFHRAFELVPDKVAGLTTLAKLGVKSVLLKPDKQTAKLKAMNLVTLIGGSGVNADNAVSLAKKVDELHVGSAIRVDQSWDEPIDVKKINQIASLLKKNVA